MLRLDRCVHWLVLFSIACWTTPSRGAELMVTIENLQPAGGYYFTPVWLGFHDGSFNLFDTGSAASPQVEAVAEMGDLAPLGALFGATMNSDGSSRKATVVTAPAGFPGAPVFDPGDQMTAMITIDHPQSNRYLTLASMVIPSNDTFFGNDNGMAYPLFTADGTFQGPVTIDITSDKLYDAGTEVNNGQGAAFSAIGGAGTDEGGHVHASMGLDEFLNTQTAAGTMISAGLSRAPLARIQIRAVPEPSSAVLSLFGLAWWAYRGRVRSPR